MKAILILVSPIFLLFLVWLARRKQLPTTSNVPVPIDTEKDVLVGPNVPVLEHKTPSSDVQPNVTKKLVVNTVQNKIFEFTLKWEGGYTNHPSDPGGETGFGGITYSFYKINCKKVLGIEPSKAHFLNLSKGESFEFYKLIWNKVLIPFIKSDKIKLVCFDFIFNSGKAIEIIQTYIKTKYPTIIVDGKLGHKTINYLNSLTEVLGEDEVSEGLTVARRQYLDRIVKRSPKLAVFTKGWNNRINDLTLTLKTNF